MAATARAASAEKTARKHCTSTPRTRATGSTAVGQSPTPSTPPPTPQNNPRNIPPHPGISLRKDAKEKNETSTDRRHRCRGLGPVQRQISHPGRTRGDG